MSMINKEVSDFKVYAFHENDFRFISKEGILGKWSVFFFCPANRKPGGETLKPSLDLVGQL